MCDREYNHIMSIQMKIKLRGIEFNQMNTGVVQWHGTKTSHGAWNKGYGTTIPSKFSSPDTQMEKSDKEGNSVIWDTDITKIKDMVRR